MTNTTQRHPRTLQEAFGPYTGRELFEPPNHKRERLNALAAVLTTLVALASVGVILAWRG